jgi:hypothetical protein
MRAFRLKASRSMLRDQTRNECGSITSSLRLRKAIQKMRPEKGNVPNQEERDAEKADKDRKLQHVDEGGHNACLSRKHNQQAQKHDRDKDRQQPEFFADSQKRPDFL